METGTDQSEAAFQIEPIGVSPPLDCTANESCGTLTELESSFSVLITLLISVLFKTKYL